MARLVLLRHGRSTGYAGNLFTGRIEVDRSRAAEAETGRAG